MRWRRPPLQHPLAPTFAHAVESLSYCTQLLPANATTTSWCATSSSISAPAYPAGHSSRSTAPRSSYPRMDGAACVPQNPPLATATCIGRLFALRTIFHELARTSHLPELAHLLLREDIPRSPHTLPRPLTAEQDQLLQQEFMRRNDLGGNVFLLLRYTGMRIGECVDLSYDCLRATGPNQWAIHVPLGKLKTERMVPVDAFVRDLVHRLRFFRSLDSLPADGLLLARPGSKDSYPGSTPRLPAPCSATLSASPQASSLISSGTPTPPRCFATGVSFPVLMKLLGHVDPAHDHALCRCRPHRS